MQQEFKEASKTNQVMFLKSVKHPAEAQSFILNKIKQDLQKRVVKTSGEGFFKDFDS